MPVSLLLTANKGYIEDRISTLRYSVGRSDEQAEFKIIELKMSNSNSILLELGSHEHFSKMTYERKFVL